MLVAALLLSRINSCIISLGFREENGFTEPTDVSRPNKRRIAPYWPPLHGATCTRGGERPGAIRVQLAPSVGGVAPWRPAVRAERAVVGAPLAGQHVLILSVTAVGVVGGAVLAAVRCLLARATVYHS